LPRSGWNRRLSDRACRGTGGVGAPLVSSGGCAMFARVHVSLILLAASAWHVGGAHAQVYPNRAVRVIIPAAAGDSCDVLSRLVGQKVSERLGQQLIIDNRPGASGQLGLQLLTQAAPDGYTIACGQGGNMV